MILSMNCEFISKVERVVCSSVAGLSMLGLGPLIFNSRNGEKSVLVGANVLLDASWSFSLARTYTSDSVFTIWNVIPAM